MKKIVLLLFIYFIHTGVYAFTVEHPKGYESGGSNQGSWKNLFTIVNKYLWYVLGVVLIGVLIYAGYLLITGEGDPNQIKTSNKLITYAFIGIIISISSFFLIRLIINLYN